MKKTILLFFVIFSFAKITPSQNWTPLNQSDKYNFQNDTANYISNTLWIDSVEVIGYDSIFYLNRVVLVCDTCQSNSGNLPNYKLYNQGHFLQKRMIKKSNDDFIFQGNHNFLLRPNASVGETWLADTLNNISAEIILQNEQEVFGNLDSVKTIQLSNGKEILISKNYGFVSFSDFGNEVSYDLQGIEGRDLGELVPDIFDFYDFEVGDVFQYRFHSGSCCPLYYVDGLWKETILSKNIYLDSIVYDIETVYNGSSNIIVSTKVITNDSLHPTNLFNQQLTTSPHLQIFELEYSYDAVNLYKDSNQLVTKTFGTFEILGANIYFQVLNYFKNSNSDILNAADYNSSFHIYKNGIVKLEMVL